MSKAIACESKQNTFRAINCIKSYRIASLLVPGDQNSYLALESGDGDATMQLQGPSITYRVAVDTQ